MRTMSTQAVSSGINLQDLQIFFWGRLFHLAYVPRTTAPYIDAGQVFCSWRHPASSTIALRNRGEALGWNRSQAGTAR